MQAAHPSITLTDDQDQALIDILSFLADPKGKEMGLAGPAGTGKTVLTKFLIESIMHGSPQMEMVKLLFPDMPRWREVRLASTTNKAATVLQEATGQEATTVHKLFKLRIAKSRKTGETKTIETDNTSPLPRGTVLLVDEASMAEVELINWIRKLTPHTKVVYIYDNYQLAPVGHDDAPVAQEIKHHTYLTEIKRQAQGNSIIPFSMQFRKALDIGIFPTLSSLPPNVHVYQEGKFQQVLDQHFKANANPRANRVLTWTNSRVHQYNEYIGNLLKITEPFAIGSYYTSNRPIMHGDQIIVHNEQIVKITNKVPATSDNRLEGNFGIKGWDLEINHSYIVFQPENPQDVIDIQKHAKKHGNWKTFYALEEYTADLRPAYACTVAKSQGSTFDNVFIDITDIRRNSDRAELARLLYTAVTRASQNIFLWGDLPAALKHAPNVRT